MASPPASASALKSPAKSELDRLAGFQLRLASTTMMNDLVEALADVSLRPAQFALLVLVDENPDISQTELCAQLSIKKANIVPMVAGLEARGLLQRAPDSRDRRIQRLRLTSKARAEMTGWKKRVATHEARMLRALSARERTQLLTLLARLRSGPQV